MSIRPLPGDVIAQIRSSIVITSLNAVVCGLVENALDAGASRISISVNYGRGNCSVEDNGIGIEPADFQEGGGLGNLHCKPSRVPAIQSYHVDRYNVDTSKYPPSPDCHGRRGEFLASLASLSLLTIASHHREYRSHNALTIHNGRVVNRQLPAPPDQRILAFPSGTRVVVRDLFGSMPVRVKQRAIELERGGSQRDFEQLIHRIVALLLPWPGEVSVSLQDAHAHRSVHLRTSGALDWTRADINTVLLSRSTALLSQASMVDDGEMKQWVPVGVAAPGISIKGCMSLHPVATKRVQFIALGVQPLFNDLYAHTFYEDVNTVFENSSFGVIEEATLDDEGRPTKTQGFTGKELKPKRGVDRWPMFFLRITLSNGSEGTEVDQLLQQRNGVVSVIADLLQMMAYEFLKKHHFRPKPVAAVEKIKKEARLSSTKTDQSVVSRTKPESKRLPARQKLGARTSTEPSTRTASPFDSWSRSKSSISANKPSKVVGVPGQRESVTGVEASHRPVLQETSEPLFDRSGRLLRKPFDDDEDSGASPASGTTSEREVVVWVDPKTKIKSLIDARTGFAVKENRDNPTSAIQKHLSRESGKPSLHSKTSKPPSLPSGESPFPIPEPPIPQVAQPSTDAQCCGTAPVSAAADAQLRTTLEGRISKHALRNAHVLGQVDRKFILAKVLASAPASPTHAGGGVGETYQTLVLIDQHAADERCRVEALLELYFVPAAETSDDGGNARQQQQLMLVADTQPLHKLLRFDLSRKEGELLAREQGYFRHWGVVYEVFHREKQAEMVSKSSKEVTVEVRALPPSILERCRLEPRLLVEMLRKEVWKRHGEGSGLVGKRIVSAAAAAAARFHDCPEGILDLIHSRACRSKSSFSLFCGQGGVLVPNTGC
jgi:DNA mismatch repair protein MLH3